MELSLETIAEEENREDECVYKKAHCYCYIECKKCDGYNYNCSSYEIQQSIKKQNQSNEAN